MEECIFCQIVKRKSAAYIVYEDKDFMGFLDIYPRVYGHLLVIPKKHFRWVYEVPKFSEYWQTVLKITQAVQRALQPDFINYFTYGIDVPHAHIHILPQKEDQSVWPDIKSPTTEQFKKIARLIKEELK